MTSKPGIIMKFFNVTKRRTNEVIWGHSNAIVRKETAKEYFREEKGRKCFNIHLNVFEHTPNR